MKRFIRRFIDDRFALTTLQNPTWEVRTQAELIAAAEEERERQRLAAPPPQTPPLTAAPQEIERELAPQIEPHSEPSVEPEFEPELESAPPLAPIGQPEPSTDEFDAGAALAPKKKPRNLPKRISRRAKKSTRARSAKKRRRAKPRRNSAPDSLPARMQAPAPEPAFAREINKLAGFLVRANKLDALSAATTRAIEQHTGAAPHDHPEHLSQRQMGDGLEVKVEGELEVEVEVEVEEYDDPRLSPHERHSRRCIICHHPDRVGIEEHFLNWRNADLIREQYGLRDFRPIYRHARATGLMEKRRENIRFAADLIIEHADQVIPSADAVLRAIQVSASLNEKGQWLKPPTHVVFSSGARIPTPQPAVVIHNHEDIPVPSAAIVSAESRADLIGFPAIKNPRNPMKPNGDPDSNWAENASS